MPRHLKGSIEYHWGNWPTASLPAAADHPTLASGDVAYASDGLKGSETTGNGTGVLVFYDSAPTPGWYSVQTGEAVAT